MELICCIFFLRFKSPLISFQSLHCPCSAKMQSSAKKFPISSLLLLQLELLLLFTVCCTSTTEAFSFPRVVPEDFHSWKNSVFGKIFFPGRESDNNNGQLPVSVNGVDDAINDAIATQRSGAVHVRAVEPRTISMCGPKCYFESWSRKCRCSLEPTVTDYDY